MKTRPLLSSLLRLALIPATTLAAKIPWVRAATGKPAICAFHVFGTRSPVKIVGGGRRLRAAPD